MSDDSPSESYRQALRVDEVVVDGRPGLRLSIKTTHTEADYYISRDEARRLSGWLKSRSKPGIRRRLRILLGWGPTPETDIQMYERGIREGLRRAAELIDGHMVLPIVAGSSVIIPKPKGTNVYSDDEQPQSPWVKFLREHADVVNEHPKRSGIGAWLARRLDR